MVAAMSRLLVRCFGVSLELDLRALGYQVAETVNGERATLVYLRR